MDYYKDIPLFISADSGTIAPSHRRSRSRLGAGRPPFHKYVSLIKLSTFQREPIPRSNGKVKEVTCVCVCKELSNGAKGIFKGRVRTRSGARAKSLQVSRLQLRSKKPRVNLCSSNPASAFFLNLHNKIRGNVPLFCSTPRHTLTHITVNSTPFFLFFPLLC